MKKKAAKKEKAANKKTAKKRKKTTVKKELNPAQVWKDISALVEAQAEELAEAVIGEGMKGQVSPVKYLFEMANIFPRPVEPTAGEDEESLAETLLDRLKIPKTPVVHDELQKEEDEESDQPKKVGAEDSEKQDEEEDEKTEAVTVH